MKFKVNISAAY